MYYYALYTFVDVLEVHKSVIKLIYKYLPKQSTPLQVEVPIKIFAQVEILVHALKYSFRYSSKKWISWSINPAI